MYIIIITMQMQREIIPTVKQILPREDAIPSPSIMCIQRKPDVIQLSDSIHMISTENVLVILNGWIGMVMDIGVGSTNVMTNRLMTVKKF